MPYVDFTLTRHVNGFLPLPNTMIYSFFVAGSQTTSRVRCCSSVIDWHRESCARTTEFCRSFAIGWELFGMKWGSAVLLLASLTPFVCQGQGLPGIESLFGDDVAARVVTREGQVSLYKDNTYWAIDSGDTVRMRQVVVTGADGHATFRVSDGSTFEVFPNSQVTFRANPGSLQD